MMIDIDDYINKLHAEIQYLKVVNESLLLEIQQHKKILLEKDSDANSKKTTL
jgi:hypothetical protein